MAPFNAADRISQTIRQLDLCHCPVGIVLDHGDPDQSVERRYFTDWEEPYRPPASHAATYRVWSVLEEPRTGTKVLQHYDKRNSGLLTGEDTWEDYTLTTRLRQVIPTSLPNQDDEYNITGRSGLVFRHYSVRRYYHFGMEGLDDFVLHRRADEQRVVLGRAGVKVDPARYYDLLVEVEGSRIRCYLDDDLVIDVEDDTYPAGKVGVRTNTLSRFESIRIQATEEQQAAWEAAKQERDSKRQRHRRARPIPALWKALAVGEGTLLGMGRHCEAGKVLYLVAFEPTGAAMRAVERSILRAVDLNGDEVWRCEGAGVLKYRCSLVGDGRTFRDFTGDGSTDLVFAWDDHLIVIDGTTGQIRNSAVPPPGDPFTVQRHATALWSGRDRPVSLNTAQLRPVPAPPGVIMTQDMSSGSNAIWAFDHELNLLWTRYVDNPKFGHSSLCYDVNDDGLDEVLAQSYLLDAGGNLLWKLEGCEFWDRYNGARHVDETLIAPLTGERDELTSVHACGAEGLIYADARTGAMKVKHELGHVQFVEAGNFRPDLPGMDVWCTMRHGNFGITALYDSHGRELFYFQPHYQLAAPRRVRWDDKQDLMMFGRGGPVSLPGLYDAEGLRVVDAPEAESEDDVAQYTFKLTDDGRDSWCFHSGGIIRIYRG